MTFIHHYTGLNTEEVLASRLKYGSNLLVPPARRSVWLEFLDKFKDPLINILLVALCLSVGIAVYSYFSGEEGIQAFLEPIGIFVAILLATGVSFWFELKSRKAFDILNQSNDAILVKVIRDNRVQEVPKNDLVVGDIILLDTGDEVPADGVLLQAVSLQVNESSLTGELMCHKSIHAADFRENAIFPTNKILRSTTLIEGHGIMQVEQVGAKTEYGKVYEAVQIDDSVQTPLNKQLDWLSRLITRMSYLIGVIIIIGRTSWFLLDTPSYTWLMLGANLLNTLMIAVTLIVVAVPEGLPLSVSLSLALSMRRMLSANNLVRRMHACETMGAVQVICTDKTGTLTQNQMHVVATHLQAPSQVINEGMAVNSTAYLDIEESSKPKTLGNPTEGALLCWLHNQAISYRDLREQVEVLEQIPFSPKLKYMATLVYSPLQNKRMLYVKGASEILMQMSTFYPEDMNVDILKQELTKYQNEAMRTLGFAYCEVLDPNDSIETCLQKHLLTFVGIVAIADPVRKEVPSAIKECHEAGIAVKIVTGDTPGTARQIARQIGIWLDAEDNENKWSLLTGSEFEAYSDEELLPNLDTLKIIARARPLDKARLVRLYQQMNKVVAVTGDGTNDAPALNQAQVGLSMGDGTSVAKEASDITIIDNSFASISKSVMWGRSLYQNIQRFILFQMTINVAACLIVMAGAFLGTQSPITVPQMLWVNLIMDTFAAMALASLPPSQKVMQSLPRNPKDFIINSAMGFNIAIVGGIFFLLLLALLSIFNHMDITSVTQLFSEDCFREIGHVDHTQGGLSSYELSLFFTFFVFFQFWNLFNARTFFLKQSFFSCLKGTSGLLIIAVCILIGQILIVELGGEMFSVVPLTIEDWLWIVLLTFPVFLIGELFRAISRLFR